MDTRRILTTSYTCLSFSSIVLHVFSVILNYILVLSWVITQRVSSSLITDDQTVSFSLLSVTCTSFSPLYIEVKPIFVSLLVTVLSDIGLFVCVHNSTTTILHPPMCDDASPVSGNSCSPLKGVTVSDVFSCRLVVSVTSSTETEDIRWVNFGNLTVDSSLVTDVLCPMTLFSCTLTPLLSGRPNYTSRGPRVSLTTPSTPICTISPLGHQDPVTNLVRPT